MPLLHPRGVYSQSLYLFIVGVCFKPKKHFNIETFPNSLEGKDTATCMLNHLGMIVIHVV